MAQTYEIPVVNETVRPFSDPGGFAMTLFQVFVGLSLGLYLLRLSQQQGIGMMNRLVGMVPGVGSALTTTQQESVF